MQSRHSTTSKGSEGCCQKRKGVGGQSPDETAHGGMTPFQQFHDGLVLD
jgi:hypothetical protein